MGYSKVTYVRTNYTWFNTNITVNNNIKLELEFEIASIVTADTGGNNCIMGNWENGYSSSQSLIFNAHRAGYFRCYAGGYYNNNVSTYTIGDRYRNTLDRSSFKIDNLTTTTSTTVNIGRTISSSNYPIYIGNGASGNSEPSDIKIVEAIIYSGDTIVAHYYPYKDTETGYGVLYDEISDTYLYGATPSAVTVGDSIFGPDVDSLSYSPTGGSQTIELASDGSWSATTDSWITLSQNSGTTGGTITVTVVYNQFDTDRTGTVVFTNGDDTATLIVIQSANTLAPIIKMFRNGRRIN